MDLGRKPSEAGNHRFETIFNRKTQVLRHKAEIPEIIESGRKAVGHRKREIKRFSREPVAAQETRNTIELETVANGRRMATIFRKVR